VPSFDRSAGPSTDAVIPAETRQVFFEEAGGFVDTPIYHREDLPSGTTLMGPAVVEQLDTTTVIPTNFKARVDGYHNIIIDIRG
jgi:N-methylhydantoinase A